MMKLDDVKWAVKELVGAALRGGHVDCECHPHLRYRGPRKSIEADASAAPEAKPADDASRPSPPRPADG